MDLIDSLKTLSEKFRTVRDSVRSEEATKTAFVLPFLQALGYDVFNPAEVVPEMSCDVGMKKGEKIDYALRIDGETQILVECKAWTENLDRHSGQLFRYFGVSAARLGILTNGAKYRFYTDIDEPNRMDDRPFLELDLENIDPAAVEQVKKFSRDGFSPDGIRESATGLKYASDIERSLRRELSDPDPDFVRLLAKKTYRGVISPQLLERFTALVRSAAARIVDGEIASRLSQAMTSPSETPSAADGEEPRIVTTEEELDGLRIVRSIACEAVLASRVTIRDTASYCGILLDDTIRKQVCRLYFNTAKKRVAFQEPDGKWKEFPIGSVEDLYSLKPRILEAVRSADGSSRQGGNP